MSTMEYAAVGGAPYRHAAPVTRTRLHLTARGRRVVTALAAAPLVFAVVAGVLAGGAALASREPSAPAGTFEMVTVAQGDSLWSIAEDVAPEHDPRDVVYAIMRLNALEGAAVLAGERLAIPAEFAQE